MGWELDCLNYWDHFVIELHNFVTVGWRERPWYNSSILCGSRS